MFWKFQQNTSLKNASILCSSSMKWVEILMHQLRTLHFVLGFEWQLQDGSCTSKYNQVQQEAAAAKASWLSKVFLYSPNCINHLSFQNETVFFLLKTKMMSCVQYGWWQLNESQHFFESSEIEIILHREAWNKRMWAKNTEVQCVCQLCGSFSSFARTVK